MTRAIQPQHLKYLVSVALAGLLALALLLAFVVFQGAAQAVTFNVNSTGDASDANTGDGNCNDGTGSCTLRAAIEQAGSGDTIDIPAGVYTLTLGTELTINRSLTLNGAGSGDTIIQAAASTGAATSRVMRVGNKTVEISGVTIRHGNASGAVSAGGIFNNGGNLTITDSTIADNLHDDGAGGIFNNGGTLNITGSIISDNLTTGQSEGGGIANTGPATVTNSTISGNKANIGGGIWSNSAGSLNITDSTISGNNAASAAGIFSSGPTTVVRSTVSFNIDTTDFTAGGIVVDGTTLTVINSTIHGNRGGRGGIKGNFATATITNSTITGNHGFLSGGGVSAGGTFTVTNTIIAGNTTSHNQNKGPDCVANGSTASGGHNLIGIDCEAALWPVTTGDIVGTQASPLNPILGPLQDNGGPTPTRAPLPTSPALDGGGDGVLGSPLFLTTDQRGAGFPRLLGAHVDIGAFEAEPPDTPQTSPFNVTKTGDSSDGLCGVGDCSLREAIASGDSGDAINIPLGVYTLTQGSELTISQNLTLTGAGSGDTIIQAAASSADATFRVFTISGGNSPTISNVTIRQGFTGTNGGGIRNLGTLTLNNSTVSGNTAGGSGGSGGEGGGGIANNGTAIITNSIISDNSASLEGGGIISREGAALTLVNTTVSGNTATGDGGGIWNNGTADLTTSTVTGNTSGQNGGGGGIWNSSTLTVASTIVNRNFAFEGGGIRNEGTLTVTDSTIRGNTAQTPGGGIDNRGSLTLRNSTVSSNNAHNAGGILNFGGTLNVTNSTISGNTANVSGGGIFNSNAGTLTVANSALTDNTANGSSSGSGGGIHKFSGTVTLTNTIIAGNANPNSPDCSGSPTSLGHNLIGDDTGCGFTPASGDLSNTDPLLGPLADNGGPTLTHALLPGSPAIDAGDNSVLGPPNNLTGDQRGEPRLSGMHVDIGAYELQATPPPTLPRMPSLQQQLDILADPSVPPELALEAINRLPGIIIGTPVVLPTSGGQVSMETWMETVRFYNRAKIDLEDAIAILGDVKLGTAARPPHVDSGVRAHANQVSVLLEGTLSVIRGLAHQVSGIDPAGTVPPHLRTDRQRIESPFLPLAPVGFGHFPVERTEVCNVESGETSSFGTDTGGSFSEFSSHSRPCVITKESFGVKAVLFHRIIPVYQEPWDVRESPIIGHQVVWYIRWVPAEHIKTIIYEPDTTGDIRMRIGQRDVLMPGLSKFWSFYQP